MKLKKAYHRFRDWQRHPSTPPQGELEDHQCPNCGHAYTGNYCPVCGQTAGDKRITWRMVGLNIMDVWGIGSRSLPHTLWHLAWRPGYFIGDYLDGHRRASYSPANMLFIVAIFYSLVKHFVGWEPPLAANSSPYLNDLSLFITAMAWLRGHPAWGMLAITTLLILPTYTLFRFAPHRPGHSLPESATIQLFLSTPLLIITLANHFLPSWFFWIAPLYYLVSFHQLFNYSWWGTLWRLALGFFFAFTLVVFLAIFPAFWGVSFTGVGDTALWAAIIAIIFLAFLFGILALGYFISKYTSRRHSDPNAEAAPAE